MSSLARLSQESIPATPTATEDDLAAVRALLFAVGRSLEATNRRMDIVVQDIGGLLARVDAAAGASAAAAARHARTTGSAR